MNAQKKTRKKPELKIYIHLGDVAGNVCANVACNCIFIKYVTLFPPPACILFIFKHFSLSLSHPQWENYAEHFLGLKYF